MVKYLTQEALEKFKKELDYLENVQRKEIGEKIKYAASFGDLTENAAYQTAKEAQGFLEGRIAELKEIIGQAEIIEKKDGAKIQIGSLILLESSNKKEGFQIVEPEEADPLKGKISYLSPLGKILLGKTKGSKIKLTFLEGKKEYKILEIN